MDHSLMLSMQESASWLVLKTRTLPFRVSRYGVKGALIPETRHDVLFHKIHKHRCVFGFDTNAIVCPVTIQTALDTKGLLQQLLKE